jgi:hypothetical protein
MAFKFLGMFTSGELPQVQMTPGIVWTGSQSMREQSEPDAMRAAASGLRSLATTLDDMAQMVESGER